MGAMTWRLAVRSVVLMALAAGLFLAGCAAHDAKLGPPRDVAGSGEMKPGRGLLTGDAGEWVIYQQ